MFSDRTEKEARSGMRFNRVLLAAAVTAGAATFAQQSPPPVLRGALETALDRNTTLVIGKNPIARVLELITQHTRVPLVMAPRTTALLPYGAETVMTVTLRGIPLREGLAGMLRPVAMTFAVRNEHIEIIPTPPLRRLGRAPRRSELTLLEQLGKTPWSDVTAASLPFQFHVPQSNTRLALVAAAREVGAGTQADVLELACERLGWSWFPSGEVIAILERTQQMNRQLDRPLALQFVRQPITRILDHLSEWADLPITLAPDALNALAPDTRENISLIAQGVTVRQALNQLTTATGLTWTLQENGAQVSAGQTLKTTPKPADPIVATITIPLPNGTQIQIPIHASDCPPELMTFLETHKKKGLAVLLEQIKSEP